MTLFTIIFIIATILSSKVYAQNFIGLTSKVFFNADPKKHDTTLITDFNSISELVPQKDSGWTVYPPTDKFGNIIPYDTYKFAKHPYFLSKFNSGKLKVMTTIKKDRVIGMELSLSFESKLTFDSTYKAIRDSYRKYSLKIIKRPNIAHPFEVTKFLSNDNQDYVIISKGKTDKMFYILIAYNYQDYDW